MNGTGSNCSGAKHHRSAASMDPEPLPVPISSSLNPMIETVLRKAVRQQLDAKKAYLNLLTRIKLLEDHSSKGTTPSGLRIKKIQAKGPNVDTLQAKYVDVVNKAEVKLLEATIANLCSKVKKHQEAIHVTSKLPPQEFMWALLVTTKCWIGAKKSRFILCWTRRHQLGVMNPQ